MYFKPLVWFLVGIGMVVIGMKIGDSGLATVLRFTGGFVAGWNFFDLVKWLILAGKKD